MKLELQRLTDLANDEAARLFDGDRATCILTSTALCAVLRHRGHEASLIRVEAAVFPDDPKTVGTILGGEHWDGRRAAARPGMWHGHLAVAVGREWLCDATIDQANKPLEWNGAAVPPLVVELNEWFWSEARRCVFVDIGGCRVRYHLVRRQVGFARAGDARPSHWGPLRDRILKRLAIEATELEVNS
jgi:hypothetical protein